MPKATSSYQSFAEVDAGGDDHDHILIQVLPPDSTSSWQNYIEDLDFFFIRVYKYHQRSGLKCIIVDQLLGLLQFIFIVFFTFVLIHLIDYEVMFKQKAPAVPSPTGKITLANVILSISDVTLSKLEVFLLIFASIYWLIQFIRVIQSIRINAAIKSFYKEALKINDVTAYTWLDVQQRLISAQHHCLISQDNQLTELDIHNRILRHTNYMVALLNKGLIPVYYNIPFVGSVTYLSSSLILNLNYLLFKGPLSLFETNWKLKPEYKCSGNRISNAYSLRNRCYTLALINLILMPLIILWQILNFFFRHVEVLKRNPNMLFASRNWSVYARLFCRHFNELDHQLNDRLNRGYKSATKYMNSFSSPFLEILAKHISFIASAILAVLIILTVYDEDVITVEHVLTIMTGLGLIIALCQAFIPDSTPMKYTQSELYTQILAHVHYIPNGYAPYSVQAQSVMTTLFPYRILSIVEELVSPLLVPFILAFCVANKSQDIIDFIRNFTIEVSGTGDVCIFAMMNVKENGNSIWKPELNTGNGITPAGDTGSGKHSTDSSNSISRVTPSIQRMPDNMDTLPSLAAGHTDYGKLELSLIHFKLHNPSWKPIEPSQQEYIQFVTDNALQSANEPEHSSHHSRLEEEADDASCFPVLQRGTSSSYHSRQTVHSPTAYHRRSVGPSLEFSQPPQPPSLMAQESEAGSMQFQSNISDLQKQRTRVLNMYDSSSRTDSQLAMTLSTLFLNEYVAGQSSSLATSTMAGPRNVTGRETDPLLGPSNARSSHVTPSSAQNAPEFVKMHPLFDQPISQSPHSSSSSSWSKQ